jgi:hypothetical protein
MTSIFLAFGGLCMTIILILDPVTGQGIALDQYFD